MTLRAIDYLTWTVTIIITFVVLVLIGGGLEPDPIGPQGRAILRLYRFVFVSGMIVAALFMGSLFWIALKFWDRSQPIEIE
ncbi:MAG: hypothetical protein V3T23_04790 [Nitrososphaerales archaeon]